MHGQCIFWSIWIFLHFWNSLRDFSEDLEYPEIFMDYLDDDVDMFLRSRFHERFL